MNKQIERFEDIMDIPQDQRTALIYGRFTEEGQTQLEIGGFGIGLLFILTHTIERLEQLSRMPFDEIIESIKELHDYTKHTDFFEEGDFKA